MNNYTLNAADRLTHMKIVAVSLIAGIVVVGVGLAARADLPDMSTRLASPSMSAQLERRAPVLKADRPVIWTKSDQITIR